jgi:hypothetical protein
MYTLFANLRDSVLKKNTEKVLNYKERMEKITVTALFILL